MQILNEMLAGFESEQKNLLENVRESFAGQNKVLTNLLIQAYSCRGHANELLQDYGQALSDYNKLVDLCQF